MNRNNCAPYSLVTQSQLNNVSKPKVIKNKQSFLCDRNFYKIEVIYTLYLMYTYVCVNLIILYVYNKVRHS